MKNYTQLYERDDWENGFCPKCSGEDKRCSQTTDGALAVCYANFDEAINIKDGAIGRYGTYITDPVALQKREQSTQSGYFSSNTKDKIIITRNTSRANEPLSSQTIDLLDQVHTFLLNKWTLSSQHYEYLKKRGFTDAQIEAGNYKTSSNHQSIMDDLEKEFGNLLTQVPGFVQILGKFYLKTSSDLIIPTRNYSGKIINFRIRDTSPKCSIRNRYRYLTSRHENFKSGLKAYLAAHVVIPPEIKDLRIWITEGEFKAHASADKLGARFISIPGVGMWSLALEALEHFNPNKVVISFDSDLWEIKDVARNLINLTNKLKESNYEFTIAHW